MPSSSIFSLSRESRTTEVVQSSAFCALSDEEEEEETTGEASAHEGCCRGLRRLFRRCAGCQAEHPIECGVCDDSDGASSSSSDGFCPPEICRDARFHLVPKNGWHPFIKKMDISAVNTIRWYGEGPVPSAPADCWLLPTSDEMAMCIASLQPTLAAAGWKLLTCSPDVVDRLSNKVGLYHHAKQSGLLEHLPKYYASPDACVYPCILKSSVGQHGKDVYIVRSREEVLKITDRGFGSSWLLQELVSGQLEYSTTLLVNGGHILDSVLTEYKYAEEEYVWPQVEEVRRKTRSSTPDSHVNVMKQFVAQYSGICNFNYKVRPCGSVCIFEINTRVGADLACDVPRERARALFERLDALTPKTPHVVN